MSTLTSVVLNNGTADETFTKIRQNNRVHILEQGNGPIILRKCLELQAYRNTNDSHRSKGRLIDPVIRQIDVTDQKVDENLFSFDFRVSPMATDAEKLAFYERAKAALASVAVGSTITNSSTYY